MRDWLRKLLTGKDNLSPDVVKIIGALMGVQFIINSAWALVVREQTWDPSAYGTGSSLLLAAIGAALWAKHKTEPDA